MADGPGATETLEPLPPVAAWRWLAAFALAASAAGWAGQRVWSGWAFVICIGVWELIWGVWRLRLEGRQGRGPGSGIGDLAFLVPLTVGVSIFVAVALVHASWAAWYLVEVALGGIAGAAAKSLLGAAFGAFMGAVVWLALRATRLPQMPRYKISLDEEVEILRKYNLQVIRRGVLFLLATLAIISWWLIFTSMTGVREEERYPPAEASPYLLPFPAGRTYLVCQGNRGVVSHREWEEFAFDFAMPVGSDVCAARGGIVRRVVDRHDGHGLHAENNLIEIDHGDGSIGKYLHIKQSGSFVRAGDRVLRGQRIAASGHVGHSMLPHLHFVVDDRNGNSQPIRFADVDSDAGIPRMFKRYCSKNDRLSP